MPIRFDRPQQDQPHFGRLDERRSEQFATMAEIGRAFPDVPDDELEPELARAQSELRAEREHAPAR